MKVVTLVDMGQVDADGLVARLRQIDLMDPDANEIIRLHVPELPAD